MKYRLLRGARIVEQLNEVSTEPQLYNNIERGFPETRKRQHATGEVNISNVEYIPYVGTKYLHVRSISTSNGHQYTQALQFMNVAFEPADTPENATFTATDNQDYHVAPIDLNDHNVKVRCGCLDFHFRFANYNSQDKSLVGRPPPLYIRKTTTRPPANPSRVPGMCKHLLALVETLQGSGLVK